MRSFVILASLFVATHCDISHVYGLPREQPSNRYIPVPEINADFTQNFPNQVETITGNNHHSGSVNSESRTKIIKQTQPIVSHASYTFEAPHESEDIQQEQTIVLPRPRQHYKVVFIKAPATTIVNNPSAAVGGQNQEKTLIYVLTDKKRIENNIDVPEIDQAQPQKPEVFFVRNNQPTQVVNSKIQYETVQSVTGADNGAVNGVPNRVSAASAQLVDQQTTAEQSRIAQSILQAVQTGGVQAGKQTVDSLIEGGHSISNFGEESHNYQQQRQFENNRNNDRNSQVQGYNYQNPSSYARRG